MQIRVTKDIWDDGDDHHPRTLLAREGEILNVLKTTGNYYEIARNGRFRVYRSECEPIKPASKKPLDVLRP